MSEHVQADRPVAPAASQPAVIVLSARTPERLDARVAQLRRALDHPELRALGLEAIAYTLQVGREPMEARLACVVASLDELADKLDACLRGEAVDNLFRDAAKNHRDVLAVFAADDDLQATLGTWAARGKLARLLDLWVKGLAFDWRRLYGERTPRRVSLPTYPFARERYWIDTHERTVVNPRQISDAGTRSDLLASSPAGTPAPSTLVERWLVKHWDEAPLVALDVPAGATLVRATPDMLAMARALTHCLPDADVIEDEDRLPAATDTAFWRRYSAFVDLAGRRPDGASPMAWIVALQRWLLAGPPEGALAVCVTRGLEALSDAPAALAGAERVALYRGLSHEHTRLRSRHVDLAATIDDDAGARAIAAELTASGDDLETCHREGRRWRARLAEQPVPSAVGTTSSFPPEHVLWVTGGTRGLGYLCARHLFRHHGVRRLLLTGREALPPRAEWARHLGGDGSLARKLRALEALVAEGAELEVSSVDLSDEQAVRNTVAAIKSQWGPIGGVIHCAGSFDRHTPAFARKDLATVQALCAPKIVGLENLLTCLRDEPLQWFVLFSSVSAAIPDLAVGQLDYAAANGFMDYCAQAYADRVPLISIQWPNWRDAGIGLTSSRTYTDLGFSSHTDADGLRLLDSVLAQRPRPVVLLPALIDPARWRPERFLAARTAPAPGARVALPAPPTPAAATPSSDNALRAWITSIVADELRIDVADLDLDTSLYDYGIDSVLLLQVLRRIGERIDVLLDPSLLFQYPTVTALASYLEAHHGAAFAATFTTVHAAGPASASVYTPSPPALPRAAIHTPGTPAPSAPGVAIVGLACRFPGAPDLSAYWHLLAEGRSALRRAPAGTRARQHAFCAGLLDALESFDLAAFPGIALRDVCVMDPQALLLLEQAFALWHHAGYRPDEVKGRQIGVYLGGRGRALVDQEDLKASRHPALVVGQNYLAANLSRCFDLHGPSLVLDTACSSALVALNMAIQALHEGEIESAIVGGVSLLEGTQALEVFAQRGLLSAEPQFHIFDGRARGAVLSEGAGLVWLKPVERALGDGDTIYAVVRAVAINNDGRTAGPSAPNAQAQQHAMQAALARSGFAPDDVTHVEVNGSGSEVNDLLELRAIEAVYRSGSRRPCELGSMKPNIGHPLCAQGIASLIKCALMLHHRRSLPFLSAREPMTHYDWATSPFHFARTLGAQGAGAAVAALNCFADGGTNAHVLLAAWPPDARQVVRQPLALPAGDKVDLKAARAGLPAREHLHTDPAPAIASFWDGFQEPLAAQP